MNKVLQRQLKKMGLTDATTVPDAKTWAKFLKRVDQFYTQATEDRNLLERSLTVSSEEMQTLYNELRSNSETQLAEERHLLRTLIDNMPDYIYAKDNQGRFILANMAVTRLMGVDTLDELLGKSDFDFILPSSTSFNRVSRCLTAKSRCSIPTVVVDGI